MSKLSNRNYILVLILTFCLAFFGANNYYRFGIVKAGLFSVLICLAVVANRGCFGGWWRSRAFYCSVVIGSFWVFSTYCFNGSISVPFLSGVAALVASYTMAFMSVLNVLSELNWSQSASSSQRFFWTSFSGLLIVWVAFWLAFYPGIMSNDSFDQWGQGSGYGILSSWHPLIHTFLIGLSSRLFNSPAPLLLLQVIFGAAVVAYVMSQLIKRGTPRWIGYLVVLAYAIYPLNGFYMTTMWKDIPYAIFLLLLLYLISEIVLTKGGCLQNWRFDLGLGITSVAVALFRKNGLYVVVILLVVLMMCYHTRRIFMIAGISMALIFGFNTYTNHVLHVVQSPTSEALAIPIQQVAAVYANHGNLPTAQRRYFNQILPQKTWESKYSLISDNPLKFDAQFNADLINASPSRFLKQWFKLFLKNKKIYVAAYLDQTGTLWKLNLKGQNFISLPGLQIQGQRENYYQEYRAEPTKTRKAIKALYATYKIGRIQAKQPVVSFHVYQSRLLKSYQNLTNKTKLPRLQKLLVSLYDRINLVGQRYIARGAWFVLVALLALAVALIKLPFKDWSLLFLVPFFNYASLFASLPASDFRYSYSLGFSVLVLFVMVVSWPSHARTK